MIHPCQIQLPCTSISCLTPTTSSESTLPVSFTKLQLKHYKYTENSSDWAVHIYSSSVYSMLSYLAFQWLKVWHELHLRRFRSRWGGEKYWRSSPGNSVVMCQISKWKFQRKVWDQVEERELTRLVDEMGKTSQRVTKPSIILSCCWQAARFGVFLLGFASFNPMAFDRPWAPITAFYET